MSITQHVNTLPARDAANRIRLAIQNEAYESVYQDSRALDHLETASSIDKQCDAEIARLRLMIDRIDIATREGDYPETRAIIQVARHILAEIEKLDAVEQEQWQQHTHGHIEMARDAGREVIALTERSPRKGRQYISPDDFEFWCCPPGFDGG